MIPEDLNKCIQVPLFQHIEDITSIEHNKSDEEFAHAEYCELCDNTTGYVYNHVPPTLYTGQEFMAYGYDEKRVESGKRHIAVIPQIKVPAYLYVQFPLATEPYKYTPLIYPFNLEFLS